MKVNERAFAEIEIGKPDGHDPGKSAWWPIWPVHV